MSKLREISEQYRELVAIAESDEHSMELVRDTMEAIGGEFDQKAQAVVTIALNMDDDCAAIDAEIARLEKRRKVITNRADSLRDYLRINMEATGISKISCPLFSITLVAGRESVVVDDQDKLPDDLLRVKTELAPDKTAIAAKLKAGEDVPGAHLERGQSSIRIK